MAFRPVTPIEPDWPRGSPSLVDIARSLPLRGRQCEHDADQQWNRRREGASDADGEWVLGLSIASFLVYGGVIP